MGGEMLVQTISLEEFSTTNVTIRKTNSKTDYSLAVLYDQLNDEGRQKVVDYAENLTNVPQYHTPSPAELIGRSIQQFRTEKNLTPKELGDMCGLTDSYIRKYEAGQKKPPEANDLFKIARALGVKISQLGPEDSPNTSQEKMDNSVLLKITGIAHQLFDSLERLTSEGHDKVIDYAEDLTKIPQYQRSDDSPSNQQTN